MDSQTLLNIALGCALGAIGWFCRQIWDALANLRQDLHRLEVTLPTLYVPKNEFRQGVDEIKIMLRDIALKIEGKADK